MSDAPTPAEVYALVMGPDAMTREELIATLVGDPARLSPAQAEAEADRLFGPG